MQTAVYTIAKDERSHVERWLEATRLADCRLVLDTGSTDGTVTTLRGYPKSVKLYHAVVSPWRFDVARNTALSLLPCGVDVCVSLDMDEVCEPDLFDKLRDEWETNGSYHRATVRLRAGGLVFDAPRIHYRHNYRWKSPIHEVIVPYRPGIEPLAERVVTIDSEITHLPDDEKSRAIYLPLLEMACEEDPTDGRMWVYLCREYWFRGDKLGMLRAGGQALALPNLSGDKAAVCLWLGIENPYGEPSSWHPIP